MSRFKKLSIPTMVLHWSVALLMITATTVGIIMEQMERSPEQREIMNIHKSIGLLILVLALARIIWRVKEGKLPSLGAMPRWQEISAASVHGLLLLLTVVMPISGIMMSVSHGRAISFFGVPVIPSSNLDVAWLDQLAHVIHGGGKWAIIIIVSVHVVAAIKHQFIDKDGTLSRMLGAGEK
ncbi:cytochrome b [Reinekea marinisedimentorum]|uniref:Cytochrome b561 n=1 Tax=Reinekea marinisedimentorum TaxID=230495 RepID=A0A4R3I5I8_9GAMM|nr:cytochrome b [Reinekea marinisedimentorum]TCS41124.1 cytochrome b561 [Reinekea marinisedimentorum]